MVALLVGGLVAHPLLPVSALQDINYPTVTVTAQLPGADPQTMASTVASPLELQFGEIPGLTQMTSASAVGYTQITLQFDLNRNMMGSSGECRMSVDFTLCADDRRPVRRGFFSGDGSLDQGAGAAMWLLSAGFCGGRNRRHFCRSQTVPRPGPVATHQYLPLRLV